MTQQRKLKLVKNCHPEQNIYSIGSNERKGKKRISLVEFMPRQSSAAVEVMLLDLR